MRSTLVGMLLIGGLVPMSAAEAREGGSVTVKCVQDDDPITRTPTPELVRWLSEYSNRWNPKDEFSIGGVGALGRMFNGNGRAVHPKELAELVSAAPSFSGKKRKRIHLGVSDSDLSDGSYARQVASVLNAETLGCRGDAYYLPNGGLMCGDRPVYPGTPNRDTGRSGPSGFALGGMTMLFCNNESESISPASMLTASMAFGLYRDEVSSLTARASTDADAAFRLYQYYWIARRNRDAAMQWLVKAADLGHDIARFNLAYEYFESGDAQKGVQLMSGLVAKGFSGPDLRKYYGGSERG